VDLVIIDIPKNLLIPLASNSIVPQWNQILENYVESTMSFVNHHLVHNGVVIVFHADDIHTFKEIQYFLNNYKLRIHA
jgi:hypothetical protein